MPEQRKSPFSLSNIITSKAKKQQNEENKKMIQDKDDAVTSQPFMLLKTCEVYIEPTSIEAESSIHKIVEAIRIEAAKHSLSVNINIKFHTRK